MEQSDAKTSDSTVSSLSGCGLNALAREADARQRLLNLTPTPAWEKPKGVSDKKTRMTAWTAGYSLTPAIEAWARRVREASASSPARVVGVVGATSAGKSWLIGKLVDDESPKPCRLEERFDGITLQSMTSDINLYTDAASDTYFIDFEGTHGTLPVAPGSGASLVMQRAEAKSWEAKRRQVLRECFQPALAYLTCNVIIFVTREKLVCSRSLEECEFFAKAANGRVVNALPPSLIIIQNCCRPAEGIFDHAECTEAFVQTHFGNGSDWRNYFRSIDCFCIPDECIYDKRAQFDGEEVAIRVVESMKEVIAKRIDDDIAFRLNSEVRVSQLQWFSVVSALCRIINDCDTVKMASLYMRAGATACGLGGAKSALVLVMSGRLRCGATVHERVQVAIAMIARIAVLREFSPEKILKLLSHLRNLFPCGAVAAPEVRCFDPTAKQVACGQMRLFHTHLHRSSVLVRTSDADWMQGLTEWLSGGFTHAWVGEFECNAAYQEYDDLERLQRDVAEEMEAYKFHMCLQGTGGGVSWPWVLKAYESLLAYGSKLRRDPSQMCVICGCKGVSPGLVSRLWLPPEGSHLPACGRCYGMLERHSVCGPDMALEVSKDPHCQACLRRDPWSGVRTPRGHKCFADHRIFPCGCPVCKECAESVLPEDYPDCPLCGSPLRSVVDERLLVHNTWATAVRTGLAVVERTPSLTGVCMSARRP